MELLIKLEKIFKIFKIFPNIEIIKSNSILYPYNTNLIAINGEIFTAGSFASKTNLKN